MKRYCPHSLGFKSRNLLFTINQKPTKCAELTGEAETKSTLSMGVINWMGWNQKVTAKILDTLICSGHVFEIAQGVLSVSNITYWLILILINAGHWVVADIGNMPMNGDS